MQKMTIILPSKTGLRAPSRRSILKGAGAVGLTSLIGGSSFGAARLIAGPPLTGLLVPQQRGPYQDNGATPWYANLGIGTPAQPLKIALDTGSNFIWSTSSLCDAPSNACKHYGGGEFTYQDSKSFAWVDQTPTPVSFGPWGTMMVETGTDTFTLATGAQSRTTFYLAASYTGQQFLELDWDGGIGFPSGSAYVQPGISFVMADLMNAGTIDPAYPYLSFNWNAATGVGTCQIGGTDPSAYDPTSGIIMPWAPYTEFPDVEYIWSTPLQQYTVGSNIVAENVMFALDSGSSQFKGDDDIMNETLSLISVLEVPVTLTLGQSVGGGPGVITVGPSVYEVKIEAGEGQGETLPQFNPLGLTNLVLVGSVLMDQLYTVFEYTVTGSAGSYTLSPANMYLFNKVGGPQLIQPGTGTVVSAAVGGAKPVVSARARRP